MPGELRLILLPGMNGTCEFFAPILPLLAGQLILEPLELPAQGAQHPAALAEQLLPRLTSKSPFLLLGESFSGPIAHRLASHLPEGLRGLILAASFLQRPHALMPPGVLLPHRLLSQPAVLRGVALDAHCDPALLQQAARSVRSIPGALLRQRFDALRVLQPPSGTLGLPVLQLVARRDRLVGQRATRAVAHSCTQLQRVDIDGPHFLLQTRPQACADAILEFAERLR